MIPIVFGTVLPWLLIAVGTWLAYQLVRQNGRILLRLEAIEKQIGPRAAAKREAGGLAIGTVAPDFELLDLSGMRRKLSEFRGQNVLLVFFNPQCGICTKMAADLAALPAEAGDQRAVPIVVTTGDAAENRKLVEQCGIRCLVLLHREHDRPGRARFAWRALALTAILSLLCPLLAVAQTPSSLYLPAPEAFTTDSHVVSTTVFHWFTATDGQLSGPWAPLEGRASWTGEPAFWQDQVKQIMSANIDIMYVHLLPYFEQQRINLFQALNQLRAQGYDVPKVAPILDPAITWYNQPNVDLATTAGKDAFVGQYTRFFNQYYSVNQDSAADSYLATMNGRVELDTWHVKFNATNLDSLTRNDVESRLSSTFGGAHGVFNHGIYMITTALNPPTLSFADEQFPQFEVTDYSFTTRYNNYSATQLKAGYWDQNSRNPGSQLPRDGGTHYTQAWNALKSDPLIQHVNIESWNEYDEGSGIYRANPGPPFIKPGSGNTATDTWSATNDPLQYIKTTAAGARAFNDTPDMNAQILLHDFPTQMKPGEIRDVSVIVRNQGDVSWTGAQQFKFGQQDYRPGEVVFGLGRFLIDDTQNEIPIYGGIFRGRPITFTVELVAPDKPGAYLTHWSMLQENVAWFGQELDWTINVVPEPSSLVLAALGFTGLAAWCWRQRKR